MKKNNMIITVIVVVVVAGAAFFGGMKYQQSKTTPTVASGQFGQAGRFGTGARGGRGAGGGVTQGEVLSIDAGSITVKLQDGSSKIVNLSDSTMFTQAAVASKADVKVGARIAAFGMTNSDGSITATNIQLNPMIFRGRGGSKPSPTPSK